MVDTEQGELMADDSEAKQFGEALLKLVQDLARQIEVMGQRGDGSEIHCCGD